MNINQTKNKENEILWSWKGKNIPITKLDVAQLENCINYTKRLPNNGVLFGKSKQYWLNHLNNVIVQKYANNTNTIMNAMVESKKIIINRYINNLTLNKTNLKLK